MGDFDNWRGNGDSDLCIPCVFPVKTEEGIMIFGTFAVIWGLAFAITGLKIAKQDMD